MNATNVTADLYLNSYQKSISVALILDFQLIAYGKKIIKTSVSTPLIVCKFNCCTTDSEND